MKCNADVLVKVSAAPHLLQLDLAKEVDSAATTATMADHTLAFTLQKVHCALLVFVHDGVRLRALDDTTAYKTCCIGGTCRAI